MHHHFPCRFCSKTFLGIKFLESHLKVCNEKIENENIKQKTDCEIEVDIQIPELGGDNNGVFHHDLWGDTFGVKPNELFMDINGGDKNRVFLHDLIKITEGTVSEKTIFMPIDMMVE